MYAQGWHVTDTNRIPAALSWIAAIIGGVLYFLGYAGFDQFYLEWICLVPVFWAIREQPPARAFLIGWLAGTVAHAGGFHWIIHMLQLFAGLPWPVATLGLLLIAAANGMVAAIWAYCIRLITRDTGWSIIWVAPVVWIAMEKCWPEIFPNYLGASQYQLHLVTQIADITGVLGVSFLVVFINSVVYAVLEQWYTKRCVAWRKIVICFTVLGVVLGYGFFRGRTVDQQIAAAEKLTVGLVQTNRGADNKRNDPVSSLSEHLEMSKALSESRTMDLIVWPESIMSLRLTSRQAQLSPEMFGILHTPLLFGAALHLEQGSKSTLYNTALLVNSTGEIHGSYDKMILVPFGEYFPFGEIFPSLYKLAPAIGRFSPGERGEPLQFGKNVLSVSICYEDIFPGQIRLLMSGGSDKRIPDLMFNLTNDSWYGKTIQPVEHLALASFRAIEHRRALVRATNTGVSAFVDPVGRLVKQSGIWTRETLIDRVPLMKESTIYALMGDWIGWVCTILSVFAIGRCLFASRRSDGHSQKLTQQQHRQRQR